MTEMFTVSNSEATRECQATLHLVEPGRVDGVSLVFYSTVRTDDGKTIFAIREGQPLAATMLRSLEVNNNLTESTDAIRRDLLRSATIKPQIDQFMRANPDFNKPAPSYPHSNFSGNGNRRGGYQGPQ